MPKPKTNLKENKPLSLRKDLLGEKTTKNRAKKNSGFNKENLPAIQLPRYEIEKRETLLNDLLLYMTGFMNTDIDPVVVENVLKKSLLPLLHDEIRMALEGSSEARRYLLDKMIPKAEKSMSMPSLNISIFLDKEKQDTTHIKDISSSSFIDLQPNVGKKETNEK